LWFGLGGTIPSSKHALNILYHNNGDGTFTDVAAHAGITGWSIWHTGAAFGDYDNDGYVDLYIAGYLDFNVKIPS
jgi:enediyne biosynthesis protein E4